MPVFDLSEVDRYGAGVPRARHLLGTADRGRTAPQGRLYWLWTAGGRRGRGPWEVPKIVAFCRTPFTEACGSNRICHREPLGLNVGIGFAGRIGGTFPGWPKVLCRVRLARATAPLPRHCPG